MIFESREYFLKLSEEIAKRAKVRLEKVEKEEAESPQKAMVDLTVGSTLAELHECIMRALDLPAINIDKLGDPN